MNADQRVKLLLGELTVTVEVQRDQNAMLQAQLKEITAERDALKAEVEKKAAKAPATASAAE